MKERSAAVMLFQAHGWPEEGTEEQNDISRCFAGFRKRLKS